MIKEERSWDNPAVEQRSGGGDNTNTQRPPDCHISLGKVELQSVLNLDIREPIAGVSNIQFLLNALKLSAVVGVELVLLLLMRIGGVSDHFNPEVVNKATLLLSHPLQPLVHITI